MKKLILVSLLLQGVTLCYGQHSVIRNVNPSEFKGAIDSLQDEVIIDLRTPGEIQNGKIAGALEIDFYSDNFKPAIEALDRNKVYLVYCAGGVRSGETAGRMEELGFKQVYNLAGGFKGWVKAKMPVDRK